MQKIVTRLRNLTLIRSYTRALKLQSLTPVPTLTWTLHMNLHQTPYYISQKWQRNALRKIDPTQKTLLKRTPPEASLPLHDLSSSLNVKSIWPEGVDLLDSQDPKSQ